MSIQTTLLAELHLAEGQFFREEHVLNIENCAIQK
jgi:hypothetical protein